MGISAASGIVYNFDKKFGPSNRMAYSLPGTSGRGGGLGVGELASPLVSSFFTPSYHVAVIGHSLVPLSSPDIKRPSTKLYVDYYGKGGARADKFFEYEEFREVREATYYNLVVVVLGGNDVAEDTDVNKVVMDLLNIKKFFELKGVNCVLSTLEIRKYPRNHPYYMPEERNRKIVNAINHKLMRKAKGHVMILGGKTYHVGVRVIDGVHPNIEGKYRIINKILNTIKHHHRVWRETIPNV